MVHLMNTGAIYTMKYRPSFVPSSSDDNDDFVTLHRSELKKENTEEVEEQSNKEEKNIVEQYKKQQQENDNWDNVVEEVDVLAEWNRMINEQVGWYHRAKKFDEHSRKVLSLCWRKTR